MINKDEIEAMLYLLDDSDERVVEEIESRILAEGPEVLPILNEYWNADNNPERIASIHSLIKQIKQRSIVEDMRAWLMDSESDLLEGMIIIEKIANPNLDKQLLENKLDKIKLDAWLELKYDLTSFEKIKILNHILFDVHELSGDTESYHSSKNSFLSSVLNNKKGNPVSLAIIYSIIAQKLNIPVYGVNLPQHFILGYVDDFEWPPLLRFNDESAIGYDEGGNIMFYINPFNKGLIFNRENINKFLKQLKLEPKDEYYKTCKNKDTIVRVLRNLEVSYAKENSVYKLDLVKRLLSLMSS